MRLISGLVLLAFCIWVIVPVAFMVYVSFSHSGISTGGVSEWSGLQNYRSIAGGQFFHSFLASFKISSVVCGVSILLGLPAAHVLATQKNKSSRLVGGWVFSTRFLPPVVAAIPLFIIFRQQALLGSFAGWVLVDLTIGLPFVIWLLKGFLEEVPPSLDHMARIDGIEGLIFFRHLLLPAIAASLVCVAALTWLLIWNEYLFALLFAGEEEPLTVLISSWRTYRGVQWGEICAAGVLALLPAIIILFLSTRLLMRGLSFGWDPNRG
jgi:multiple sugar transport system permease protein